jgi:hypothetical protein
MSNRLAQVGLAIALIAVGMAAFQNNDLYPAPQPEAPKTTLKEVVGEAAKKLWEEKILRRHDTLIRVSAQTAPNHRELLYGALDQRKPSAAYQTIKNGGAGYTP